MSASPAYLALTPERCDGCGRCVAVCPKRILKVGSGYIYVDTSVCDGCMACVEVCDRGAIVRRSVPSRPKAVARTLVPGEVAKVVVGSRAEAKFLRQAAQTAERDRVTAAKADQKAQFRSAAVTARLSVAVPAGAVSWTLFDATVVLAVLAALVVGKEAVLASRVVSVMPAAGQVASRALVLGAFYALLAGMLTFLAHRHGQRLFSAFGLGGGDASWTRRAGSAMLVVALLVATRLSSMLWGALARAIQWLPPVRGELTAVFGSGGVGLFLSVIVVVLAGPLVEELVFRGVVLRAALGRFTMWPAIAGSAALFALSHATAWTLVPTFVLGIALGWLATTRGSLWVPIALHGLYNGVVIAAAFWLAR